MTKTTTQRQVWVVVCHEGHGWEECYDGLWGSETRIYRTKREALAHARRLAAGGDWTVDGEDQTPPEYEVKHMDVVDVLEDGHLHNDMLSLLAEEGDAAAEAAIAAEQAADELRRTIDTMQQAIRRNSEMAEAICRSAVEVIGGKGSGVHGLSVEVGAGRATLETINSLPEHSPLRRLAELTIKPLAALASELNESLYAKCTNESRVPCVLSVTPDAECVMVYQVTHTYGRWDGWWAVANLRTALAGGPMEKMTPEACRAKGVFR